MLNLSAEPIRLHKYLFLVGQYLAEKHNNCQNPRYRGFDLGGTFCKSIDHVKHLVVVIK